MSPRNRGPPSLTRILCGAPATASLWFQRPGARAPHNNSHPYILEMWSYTFPISGVSCHVESCTRATDGKGPGFAWLHMRSARNGEGPDGWAPRAAPAIRETVFGRDAGHGRGDDHVTRGFDAIAARAATAARPSTRRPPGRSRRHPTSSSGCSPPFPLPVTRWRRLWRSAATPACARPAEPGALAALDRAAVSRCARSQFRDGGGHRARDRGAARHSRRGATPRRSPRPTRPSAPGACP